MSEKERRGGREEEATDLSLHWRGPLTHGGGCGCWRRHPGARSPKKVGAHVSMFAPLLGPYPQTGVDSRIPGTAMLKTPKCSQAPQGGSQGSKPVFKTQLDSTLRHTV